MFRTLKYHPAYPDEPFDTLEEARQWVEQFQHWYNEEHRHSALNFVTPGQRHRGEDHENCAVEAKYTHQQKPRQNDETTEVIAN